LDPIQYIFRAEREKTWLIEARDNNLKVAAHSKLTPERERKEREGGRRTDDDENDVSSVGF